MFVLSLEIVHGCNLNCKYCYLGEKKKKIMDFEMIKDTVNLALRQAVKQRDKTLDTYFIGGEPLIQFDLIKKAVEYIKLKCREFNLNYTFSTTSNGTLLNKEIIDFFIREKFDLKISIDGNKEFHDLNRKYYSGKGSYLDVIDKIPLIKRYEKDLNTVAHAAQVITTNNVDEFFENFKHLITRGFRYIETDINKYDDWTKEKKEKLEEQLKFAINHYIETTTRGEKYYWRMMELYVTDYFSEIPFYQCKAGANSMFVTVDGICYPCQECRDMEIGTMQNKVIDVSKIRRLIHIEDTENKSCLNCEYRNHCRAKGCIMDNYEFNRDIYNPVEISCYITRLFLNEIDKRLNEQEKNILKENLKNDRRKISNF